ncbi:MAG: FtsX-like permease family protein [Gammaproteobacteria bacterium]|nr:FtsX-like permease family protein [Gammaproteobacteria bacterium]
MFRQILEITVLNIRNLPARLGSSSVVVVGIGGVVGVLVAILAMGKGFESALDRAGAPDRAIVLRGGSSGELSSFMDTDAMNIVASMPEVTGSSGELFLIQDVPKRSNLSPANLAIRGVAEAAFDIHPEVVVVEGRRFETGKAEMIAGRKAAIEFEGVDLDATMQFRESSWTIVGFFEADGSAYESEVWVDLATAQSAFRRPGVSSMRVRLESADVVDAVAKRVEEDPRLDLELRSEEDYYAEQSEGLTALITNFGYAVAAIMAIGAVFAALNTMYTAVSARAVEIATLRALGFSGLPVVVSVVIEAIALAMLGGVIGAAVAYIGFNGWTVSTLAGGSFSQIAFDFAVTPDLLQLGFVWAVTLGLVGGLFPAVRAARLPIVTALRGE